MKPTGRPPTPPSKRFWTKVRIDLSSPESCWEWTAAVCRGSSLPYGRFMAFGENYAHRVSWILANGPIPYGVYVLHRCDNPRCVRPSHLFLGTLADNMQNCIAKSRKHIVDGPKNPMARFDWPTIRDVRHRLANGESQGDVALTLGVRKSYVGKIYRREIWRKDPLLVGVK